MTLKTLVTPAIRVAAAGLGAAVAGSLGGALGGVLGAALIETYAGKFGEEATKKLLDLGADSLVEKLKGASPTLETASRETLRLSLKQIHEQADSDFDDWFANWDLCLKMTTVALALPSIQPDQLTPNTLDNLFRNTLERLDAQGTAIRKQSQSIGLRCREIPNDLLSELNQQLPQLLETNFSALIVKPEYEQAWKGAEQQFQEIAAKLLDSVKKDTTQLVAGQNISNEKLDELLRRTIASAENDKRIDHVEARALRAEAAEKDWKQKYLELAKSDPPLQELLSVGDLAAAARKKAKQIEMQSGVLAKNYFELGTIHELRFDWPSALVAYREAWQLEHNLEYGFKYAYSAQRQNHFPEAIGVYEALRHLFIDPADIATMLNNLAILYSGTQRMKQAEDTYGEALSIYRQLAQANPDAYLRHVASILNNLAVLYRTTQRLQQAEDAYREALSAYRKLANVDPNGYSPFIAGTLNNLAVLYRSMQRMKKAAEAYGEALSIYRQLAQINPDAYLPYVAMALNNLAILYRDTQHLQQAENAYNEALSTYRQLAQTNPDAYLPYVAATLNNFATLYRDSQHLQQAEAAYNEALSTYRWLMHANPDTYLPDIAMALNNLAVLYRNSQRLQKAEDTYREALSTYRQLAEVNRDAYRPHVAGTLNNLAVLYRATQRMKEAGEAYDEALSIYRQLAEANPSAYLAAVATTLNNLANLYRATQRMTEAESYCGEAEDILCPLWRVNPEVHGDQMAEVLSLRALLCEERKSNANALAFARRAFAVAYNVDLKKAIQQQIDQLCVNSKG